MATWTCEAHYLPVTALSERVGRRFLPGWRGRAEEVAAISELVFDVPLSTVADAARILGLLTSTMAGWAKGCTKRIPDGRTISGQAVVT